MRLLVGVWLSLVVTVAAAADSPEATYRRLFDLVDLGKPYLAEVKAKVDGGDLAGAMVAYRANLAARVASLPKWTRFGYSLWQPADADELLRGDATTARYGDTTVHYTGHIGQPGAINWFATHPEYRDFPRDMSNLHFVNKHAEAYLKTQDARYLVAWWATMADFAERWPAQWAAARRDPVVSKTPGLGWITGTLMTGMRLYAVEAGLTSCLQTALAAGQLDQVDPRALALVLTRVATAEMGYGLPTLKWAGGNQVRILASEVLNWGLLVPEMKDAAKWRREAVPANIGTCLLDGSDQEQSLNYFNNGIAPLVGTLRRRLPPEEQDTALLAKLETMSAYRGRVCPAIARPNGFIPGTGTDPVWDKYGKTQKLTPPSTAFTSILLPYGGYAVQRDGWKPDSLYLFMKTTRPNVGHWRPIDGCLQLSAYGRDLLVSPNGQVYDARESAGGWHACWNSAVSQNGIVVDGRSAGERKGPFDQLDPWRWHSSARYDFMETVVSGPYRGADFRVSRVPQPKPAPSETAPKPVEVSDVVHRRGVHFLRAAGVWLVTDRLRSAQPHDFTQGWSLGPEFGENDVALDPAAKTMRTRAGAGPNLSLYQFGLSDLRYERFFGLRDETKVLGWVGIMADRDKWLYTPAVNLQATWRAQGERVLVTLVVPRPSAAERVSGVVDRSADGQSGFDAVLPDGRAAAYRAAVRPGPLEALGLRAEAESLLVVRDKDGRLTGVTLGARSFDGQAPAQADFEFELTAPGQPPKTTAIAVPTGFRWEGEAKTLAPAYAGTGW